jgi:hypothetical protein
MSSTDLTRLILLLCWSLLHVRSYIHPTFTSTISSYSTLSAWFTLAQLTFCPGLFDTICMPAPPNYVWFKSLPSHCPKNSWGIYVLVLKKPGCTPYIYIGSGTASKQGVSARFNGHRTGNACPQYVLQAKRHGYTITHMALLVSCPIPAPDQIPRLRVLLLLLEAAFTCMFWSLCRRDKPYGIEYLAPWSVDSYPWDGLCSHSPLLDSAQVRPGDLNLTPEQLSQAAAIIKDKDRTYQSNYGRAQRANPTPEYTASRKAINQRAAPKTKAREQAAIANKTYHCSVCNVSCRNASDLRVHLKTKRHLKKTEMGEDDYNCELCVISFRYLSDFNAHKRTKGHIARERYQQS